jgi:branched-chain amino acid aminotransferase
MITPSLEAGILEGITRGLLLRKIAASAGVVANETVLRPADLPKMSECFTLSSTKDVTPVGAIDDLRFKVGPETVSMKLKAAFAKYVRESADAHPDLKV